MVLVVGKSKLEPGSPRGREGKAASGTRPVGVVWQRSTTELGVLRVGLEPAHVRAL